MSALDPAVVREAAHGKRRAAATKARAIRTLQLVPPGAVWPAAIILDDGYPYRGHRSMAEVMTEEAGDAV
jgi:hypothetical protein